jgi:transcriptional regulator with XRE-family HTH domain
MIGRNITLFRKALKLSQAALGKAIGETRSKIDSYESGRAAPKFEVAKKLAVYFGVDIEQLYNQDLGNEAFRRVIKSDFKGFLKFWGVSAEEVSRGTGISVERIKQWEENKTELTEAEINLLSGWDPSMVTHKNLSEDKAAGVITSENGHFNISNVPLLTGNDKRNQLQVQKSWKRRRDNHENAFNHVPIVLNSDLKAFLESTDRAPLLSSFPQFQLIPGYKYEEAIWRYWEMPAGVEKFFEKGDIILTTRLAHFEWQFADAFGFHVIVAHDRVVFGRCYVKPYPDLFLKDHAMELVLIDESNSEASEQLINFMEIEEVWTQRASIIKSSIKPLPYNIKYPEDLSPKPQ